MDNTKIFVCENSIDGIFTAIYQAWSSGYGHANVKIEEQCDKNNYSNMELFSEYIIVKTDFDKALKVSKSVKNKISQEAFDMVCRAALSDYQGKGDLIYRFLILGFHMGGKIVNHLSHEVVNRIFKLNRYVNYEVHHLLGFIRFSEQDNRILTSIIHPKNNVLSLVTPHFADRLPNEKFVIFDGNRNICSLHVPGKSWIIAEIPGIEKNDCRDIVDDEYGNLWKAFFDNIAIKERVNPKLQRNNLPLRFRKDMTEFITGNAISTL
ncbi:MAG TPA: DNA metabolism protein [Clostridiales bacterium]|jgi:probable DNA metabolism protein|nr:DNA metabolism protein [Clostridiales bacterium]